MPERMESQYQFADSVAARMLSQGIVRLNEERGVSLRQLGKKLGYKQAVVLSHMANGRTPIPIDRAEDLAEAVGLDKAHFLRAVVMQRHPAVGWHLLSETAPSTGSDSIAHELEAILGGGLKSLTKEQRVVMREVANDPHPIRRWLTVHEMPAVEALRRAVPGMKEGGIDPADLSGIEAFLRE